MRPRDSIGRASDRPHAAEDGPARGQIHQVAVLCAARNSVYHEIPYVDVYDIDRDARTFKCDKPVVAHPPCRAWSAYCAHQAKPLPGERELGLWCCDVLRQCGGVLEQPAHSRLFAAGQLPVPPGRLGDVWSMQVDQCWWGDSRKKATWLCFSMIDLADIVVPFCLRGSDAGDRRRWQVMSHQQRSATIPSMAEWLVDIARMANRCD
jgi:hypothetical protein